jgi:hypothetical protein
LLAARRDFHHPRLHPSWILRGAPGVIGSFRRCRQPEPDPNHVRRRWGAVAAGVDRLLAARL